MAEVPKLAMTLQEACSSLGIGETLMRKEIKAGRILPSRIGDRVVFPVPMLEAYLLAMRVPPPENAQ